MNGPKGLVSEGNSSCSTLETQRKTFLVLIVKLFPSHSNLHLMLQISDCLLSFMPGERVDDGSLNLRIGNIGLLVYGMSLILKYRIFIFRGTNIYLILSCGQE